MTAEIFGTLGNALKSISEITRAIKSGQQKTRREKTKMRKARQLMPFELRAMGKIWGILSQLDDKNRDRTVKYIWEKNEDMKKTLFDSDNKIPIEEHG